MARIAVLHTNDLHSHLDRWPHTAAAIRRERNRLEAEGIPTLYVDAGDFLDMSDPLCYTSGGQVAVDLLHTAGCAALTTGNNEIWRMRPAALSALASRSPFPWLAGNLRRADGAVLSGLHDWIVVQAGPLRVGLVGLTELRPLTAPLLGLSHPPFPEPVRESAAAARAAGADLVILVSHSGIREDREMAGMSLGLDAVIGGHSHQALTEPEVHGGIPVAQAGSYGEYVGVLELEYDPADRRVSGWSGRLIPVDASEPDAAAAAVLLRHRQAGAERLSEVLTILDEPLPHDPVGESPLGSLLAEVLRRRADAEIGLVMGCQVVAGLPAGPVTLGHVMHSFQALFQPTRQALPGRALLRLLEESQDPAIVERPLRIGALRPQGLPAGRVHTAGVTYEVDRNGQVRAVQVNGEPLQPDREYIAGMGTVFANPRTGYTVGESLRFITAFVPEQARELMAQALRDGMGPGRPNK